MNKSQVFRPARTLGLIFQGSVILLLIAAGTWGAWQASRATIGPVFLLYLALPLSAFVLVPALAYRAYALYKASYVLMRDGLHLSWGLRSEDIPMDTVLWVHPPGELEKPLSLPWLHWFGSIVGVRHLHSVGIVEFLAGSSTDLILIATPSRVYAISPADPKSFLHSFQRFAELGSLTPLPARSVYPSFLLAGLWATPSVRYILLAELLFSLALLVWVSLVIPTRSQIPLGFGPNGTARDLVPAIHLLLLPVLNTFFVLIDLFAGLFFYRREESHFLAYLLWFSGAVTPVLFLISVYAILNSG